MLDKRDRQRISHDEPKFTRKDAAVHVSLPSDLNVKQRSIYRLLDPDALSNQSEDKFEGQKRPRVETVRFDGSQLDPNPEGVELIRRMFHCPALFARFQRSGSRKVPAATSAAVLCF